MEEFENAQKDQDRLQDELEVTCESVVTASKDFTNCGALYEVASANLNGAFREVSNCPVLHEVTCVDLKKACQRTAELKRKAADAHERTRSHRELCRRATKEHTKSEAAINPNLGVLGMVCQRNGQCHKLSDLWSSGPRE